MMAVIVAAQMFGSIAYDHFGVLHAAQPVTWTKILGAGLLLAGVWLILPPGK